MNVRDRVSLTDAQMTHFGVITCRRDDGMCSVKWDSGMTELIHENELTFVEHEEEDGGAPSIAERIISIWRNK